MPWRSPVRPEHTCRVVVEGTLEGWQGLTYHIEKFGLRTVGNQGRFNQGSDFIWFYINQISLWLQGGEQGGEMSDSYERLCWHKMKVGEMEKNGSMWDLFWSRSPPQGNWGPVLPKTAPPAPALPAHWSFQILLSCEITCGCLDWMMGGRGR